MNQAGNAITIDTAGQAVEFRRIEIGQTHPNPGSGVCARSQTEAVAVPDVANDPGEGLALARWQTSLARVGVGGGGGEQKTGEDQKPFHRHSLRSSAGSANGRRRKKEGRGRPPRSGARNQEPEMRPLPSSTPKSSGRPSAPLFDPPHGGDQEFDDATLLSLLMTRTMAQRDIPEAVDALLDVFGSVAAVVAADPPELARAARLDATTITDLKMLRRLSVRLARSEACRRPVLSSWSALVAYVRSALAHEPREQFRTLYLDKKNILLRDEFLAEGTVDHAPVYPREVVRRALEVSASALILVHNHPSGDPAPSRADIEMTRQIVDAARVFGLQVHDHLVIGRQGTASFKQLGLI